MVYIGNQQAFTVADIPGLIEGSHTGKGLGIQFLRHVERTKALLFMIDSLSENPKNDFKILRTELKKYNPDMEKKRKIVCFSRIDAIPPEKLKEIKKIKFSNLDAPILYISSVANISLEELKGQMWSLINDESA